MARAGRKTGASSSGGSAGGGGFALTVAAVGRGRGEPAQILFDNYVARLPWPLRLVEIRESREATAGLKAAEGKKLAAAVPEGARVIALDPRGDTLSSEAFARLLGDWRDSGVRDAAFFIGGADGLEPAIVKSATKVLSFGPMIWPHMLVRAMLAEQLWRAASILSGHPYHRA
ncbi:MAG: 23S rRNA (pseudouridine(1915)-N(3))-methyltransferase RlmH [Alphaproteobacteria bacterium]|jgi:23S rRNA (pseudouridine1915-N3)-methyltransferase|nr:23S rRNA (pseudouridine(1915)-N(3))-methyltransferase RlmH [Alphaproteobacteria bacterium]